MARQCDSPCLFSVISLLNAVMSSSSLSIFFQSPGFSPGGGYLLNSPTHSFKAITSCSLTPSSASIYFSILCSCSSFMSVSVEVEGYLSKSLVQRIQKSNSLRDEVFSTTNHSSWRRRILWPALSNSGIQQCRPLKSVD